MIEIAKFNVVKDNKPNAQKVEIVTSMYELLKKYYPDVHFNLSEYASYLIISTENKYAKEINKKINEYLDERKKFEKYNDKHFRIFDMENLIKLNENDLEK